LNVALDPNSRSMTIQVRFPNTDTRLMPGMFATAEINLPAKARAVYVPTAAVAMIANGQSSAVYVIEGTTAHVRVVQTGETQLGLVRILAGIDGGSIVATSKLDQLFDGVTVRTTATAVSRTSARGK
jgi:multidrug efflux pump subunit AcrA (membrane-fusion protein)